VLAEIRFARLPGMPQREMPPREETAPEPAEPEPDGPAGEVLGKLAPGEPRLPEEIADALGWPVDRVLGVLLELEIGARIRRMPGGVYQR
jgi:predicted Rossmann fold nucleotide-binding protein DprA/Smf involved in DNA uptake